MRTLTHYKVTWNMYRAQATINQICQVVGKHRATLYRWLARIKRIGIRATLQYEKVTPFVCFGWGVDFAEGSSIRDRAITMNEFYSLNQIFVHKRENYAPVSMYFREKEWSEDELYNFMKDIAEASSTYIY